MFRHTPVLLNETINALGLNAGSLVVDCTTGGGGHSHEILRRIGENGHLLCFDQDHDAIAWLQQRFQNEIAQGQVDLRHQPFSELQTVSEDLHLSGKIDCIFADIGVSSHQIDTDARGFSFARNGPLDMRMDTSRGLPVNELLQKMSVKELRQILWDFGEEPMAPRIAEAIVKTCKEKLIETTDELAEIVKSSSRYRTQSKKHVATKTFQALRIFVNDELGHLQSLLDQALPLLKPGGILAIITFHSLEDRLVKKAMKNWSTPDRITEKLPVMDTLLQTKVKLLRPFPIKPSLEEIAENPRARSAKLRVCYKK